MRWSQGIIAFCLTMIVSFSAMGDDIEIYYGISDKNLTVNPNVIFIFDTSGSMSSVDGTSSSRMSKSKEALKLALNNISGVNVSLMRFSNSGGPVLMPAVDIDSDWESREIVKSLVGNNDFAISYSNGTLNTVFSRDYLVDDNHARAHGMRFTGFEIPKGATIESAHVTYFSEDDSSTNDVTFEYFGSLLDDPVEFVDGATFADWYQDSSGNPVTTTRGCGNTGVTCWMPNGWLNEDYPMNTPNLAATVQAIIDDANWKSGDPILLFGQSDTAKSSDRFQVFSHAAARFSRRQKSPQLRVRYSVPSDGSIPDNFTARDKLFSLLEEFVAEGATPVVDTMYEAYLYINGKGVLNGASRGSSSKLQSLSRLSHSDTYIGSTVTNPVSCDTEQLTSYECRSRVITSASTAKYVSPIDATLGQCQANYLVLFSDGKPNSTGQASAISAAIGKSCSGENCATELAAYMATKPSERSNNANDAQVFTYTVGFESSGFDDQYLKDLAIAGKGAFHSGNTANELASAFTSIFIEAKKGASTFVAPGISVNQFNRLTHSNDIYYALFDPRSTEYWPGNLKKYKLVDSVVQDNAGVDAISVDGFFRDDAHDYWSKSSALDGSFVSRGGATANQAVPRKVYSDLANKSSPIIEDDSRITTTLLGIDANDDDYRKTLIQWMRGYDMADVDGDSVTNEARFQTADPLHSEPLFFDYGEGNASVYIGTNEGYLLSINVKDGSENWAFMPQELLKNLPIYYQDGNVFNSRTYGMDGAINAWTENGRKYIIVGQRRGGNKYHVLDVTSRTAPVYKYAIEGGTGAYARLGQSWSKPTVTSIDVNGETKKVLVFGGGYDTNQDDVSVRTVDTIGNAVFIVEASSGNKIAEISNHATANHVIPEMQYSIPARIAVIDRDFDGNVDHLYAPDMGGNLFRIDVYNGQPLSKLFVGKKIYTTSQNNSVEKNRRYYNAPDVAEIVHENEHYYAVSIGSGYRAHPLDEIIQDSVVMIKDKGVFAKSEGLYTFPTISNMAQITPANPTVSDISSYDGYEFNLETGEKVITGVSVINSRLIFSTYDPSTAGLVANSCSAAQGGGKLYVIDLVDGSGLLDVNNDGVIDYSDTYVVLDKSGIPAEPRLIITDPSAPTLCIGTECADTVESADDEGDIFKLLLSQVSGQRSLLNKIFTNSWSTEIEPSTKDDNE